MSARKTGFKQLARETPSPLEIARQIAPAAAPSVPQEAPEEVAEDYPVGLNMRAWASTTDALLRRSQELGVTQKQVVMQGLVKMGVMVSPADLEDGSPAARRRKRARKS